MKCRCGKSAFARLVVWHKHLFLLRFVTIVQCVYGKLIFFLSFRDGRKSRVSWCFESIWSLLSFIWRHQLATRQVRMRHWHIDAYEFISDAMRTLGTKSQAIQVYRTQLIAVIDSNGSSLSSHSHWCRILIWPTETHLPHEYSALFYVCEVRSPKIEISLFAFNFTVVVGVFDVAVGVYQSRKNHFVDSSSIGRACNICGLPTPYTHMPSIFLVFFPLFGSGHFFFFSLSFPFNFSLFFCFFFISILIYIECFGKHVSGFCWHTEIVYKVSLADGVAQKPSWI